MSELSEQTQLDILTLLVRLHQIDTEQKPEHWLWERVITCDIPRVGGLITPEFMAGMTVMETGEYHWLEEAVKRING